MIVFVKAAEYISDYKIAIEFNTGESAVVDFAQMIKEDPLAAPLADLTQFKLFYLDPWPTLAWQCGYDIAPESVYCMATGKLPDWMLQPVLETNSVHSCA
jgi:hypothetical protein